MDAIAMAGIVVNESIELMIDRKNCHILGK
jgi:hypothetical protein